MPPQPRIVIEPPDVENTILSSTYQASSPARFSTDDDKFIMYGGGPSFIIQCKNVSKLRPFSSDRVSLFVLSSNLVIWSHRDGLGIEIPYQLIYLHALDKNSLYLQVKNDSVLSDTLNEILEIRLAESGDKGDENELFTKVNGSAEAIYGAMTTCSAMHFDSEEEEDSKNATDMMDLEQAHLPTIEVPESWLNGDTSNVEERPLKNDGHADDLDGDVDEAPPEEGVVAAMSVDVGYAPIAGSKRTEQDDDIVVKEPLGFSKRNRKE